MPNKDVVLQVGVKVLLKNGQGKYLLLRRNPEKYPEVGSKWDIVGGRIKPGIPLLENLKREVLEETKLILEDEPKLVAAQDILRVPGRHVVRLTFMGIISGTPQIDEESMEYKWFSAEEILSLPIEELDIFFRELLNNDTLTLSP